MTANKTNFVSKKLMAALLGTLMMATGCSAAAAENKTASAEVPAYKANTSASYHQEVEDQLKAIEAEAAELEMIVSAPAQTPVETGACTGSCR